MKCPECGGSDVAEIIYGYIGKPDEELQKKFDKNKVTLGGCCVSDDDPRWECNACGMRWGKRQDD